jgi:hypothetical protein
MTAARIGRGTGFLLAALIGLGPVAACSSDGPKAGEARLDLTGRASVIRQGGKHEDVSTRTTLRVGDAVTLTTGTGVLHLNGGSTMELRAGTGDTKDTALVMGPAPVLQAGDLLVTAADEEHVTADQTNLTITAGSARITRSVGVRVAAYDADVALDSAGQQRTIPALREMTVPALGLPPEVPKPLEYNATDAWDRRFLGEAIDLGDRLEALAAGLTQNLTKGTARGVTFYEQILPALSHEPEFTADLLDPKRDAGETLIGAAITELGRRGTFTERWRSVFAFRDQRAAWGLVALDQGVDRTPLLGSVTTAVGDAPLAIGPPRPRQTPPVSSPSAPTTTVPTVTAPTTTTTQPSSPTTTVPPAPSGGGGLLSPVLDPVTNLLSGVLKALLGGLLGG